MKSTPDGRCKDLNAGRDKSVGRASDEAANAVEQRPAILFEKRTREFCPVARLTVSSG